ncbi:HNH endonuclease signature motif containing protein [Bacillus sp. WC2507]|uniref:HNH endonuclease signature motif containing protein n=1 Tax=Bacillus sp. WC2507 TaxID=3461404 RepID=UPI00404281B7
MGKYVKSVEKPSPTVQERFDAKWIEDENGCWNWTAYRNEDGYGQFNVNGKTKRANRVAYQLHKGDIPRGLEVCHTCEISPCVNPDHLILGTQKQNNQHKIDRYRQHWQFPAITYLEMGVWYQIGMSLEQIAQYFGIKKETLRHRLKDLEQDRDRVIDAGAEEGPFYYVNRAKFEDKQSAM